MSDGETERSNGSRGSGWELPAAALATAGGLGALAVTNWLIERNAPPLDETLAGERQTFSWTLGDIAYTVKGQGKPLVLIHGVYAGASSFEYRRVFDRLAREFRVYAFDLLGFGLSDHPALVYTPTLYEDLIEDFVRQVVGGADHPVSAIASSLGAAFTIRAAAERPGLFSRLVLIEPTGMRELADASETPLRQTALALLRAPLLGQSLYNVIASRWSIRAYLRSRVYTDETQIDDEVVRTYYASAHRSGARFAPASFIAGALNTPVASVYPLLRQPILLCWGKDARVNPLENARAFREANPRTELRVFDCGALPQDELPEEFLAEASAWLLAERAPRLR